ncbi:MAG TPA: alpha-amylase family glycosyl hydrolase [Chloroflexota bacterium]|nr:alpha-amylase family glycosyl hydrolase [Chloroflexota bacterium]
MAPTQHLWWQHAVIYQIYPRSFQDSNGDGVGDLPGITQRLDYLHDVLGVDAVWLSPFYPSPMADFGYDVSDYCAVDPIFGTLDDFDVLVAALHERGIKILIDYIPNHTSDHHPWFQESRSSRDNPKRDWYYWRDGKAEGGPPNNWLSVFGGSAWQWDEHTGQYYLHSFLAEQPDLNWRHPEVVDAMLDVMRFWLDRGVDGFRIDVAHYLMKDPQFRDNPPAPPDAVTPYKSLADYDSQLHVYDLGNPDTHEVFRKIRRVLDSYSAERPRTSVAEIHVFDWSNWASYFGVNLDEIHMPFNFGLVGVEWDAIRIREVVDAVEGALPSGAWPSYVLGNHDEPRLATRFGAAYAPLAAMLILTLRGTPTTYYGDEIGMHDVPIPPERARDPWGKRVVGLGRDPERTPMQWDSGPNAGFCPPDVEPWLPIADDYRQINVAAEEDDPRSLLTLSRRLLALRRVTPALRGGSYAAVERVPSQCFVYTRRTEDDMCVVALNVSDIDQLVTLEGMTGTVCLSTYLDREGPEDLQRLILRPHEGCIVQIESAPPTP